MRGFCEHGNEASSSPPPQKKNQEISWSDEQNEEPAICMAAVFRVRVYTQHAKEDEFTIRLGDSRTIHAVWLPAIQEPQTVSLSLRAWVPSARM